MGTVSFSISTSSSEPPIYIPTCNEVKFYLIRWNHPASYCGLSSELEDIRLLLEQRSDVVSMDTIRGSSNSGSNPERVFTKSERLARESGVDQLCNRGAPPDRQSPTTV
ncbi:hypothetical protein Gotur_024536 [Gossypium turneri]